MTCTRSVTEPINSADAKGEPQVEGKQVMSELMAMILIDLQSELEETNSYFRAESIIALMVNAFLILRVYF